MQTKAFSCRIIKIEETKIIVLSPEGKKIEIFYEDLPFYANKNSFTINQNITLKKRRSAYPVVSQNQNELKNNMSLEIRLRKKKLMSNLNFKILNESLNHQVENELNRLEKGE